MSWNYTPALLPTSKLMQVRYLLGDTLIGDQQMQDEEINYAISQYTTIFGAAADLARALAMKFARQVDVVQGELKTNYSARSKQYFALARDLENRGLRGLLPYAGGISNTDKEQNVEDADRAPPSFNRGQFDDLLPVGPVGEQTPLGSSPDSVDTDAPTFP